MKRTTATAVAVCLLALCGGVSAIFVATGKARAATANKPAAAALRYLLHHELSDGGFPLQSGQKSSTMPSGWAAMAIGAARTDGLLPSTSDAGTATITYLERTVKTESGAGSIERTVLGLRALRQPVTDVNGVDLLNRLKHLIGRDGSVQNKTNLTSWAILALRSAGASVPVHTVSWLERQEDGDGGFNFATGSKSGSSDPDDTGAVLEALAAANAIRSDAREVARVIRYLHRDQNKDGGFGDPLGAASNTESTAWATQGLIAAGVKPSGFHRSGGRTPIHYLTAMTRPSGEVAYSRGVLESPVWTTAEVLPALLKQAYPVDVSSAKTRTAGGHEGRQAPAVGRPLAGKGGALKQVQPDIPLSLGRLIVSLHSLL